MPKAIIVYGSTTGNTETFAGYISEGLQEAGVNTTVRNVTDVDIQDLTGYDLIFLGSSTWGDGELQDDFIYFYDQMEGFALDGKKGAAFGLGDSSYDQFCQAVDLLENRLKECGVEIIAPGLKVDGDVDAAEDLAKDWAKKAASAVTA